MSYNLTGDDSISAATRGINVVQLILIVAPSIILSGLCIVGLIFAKSINPQMRVILANILIPGLVFSTGSGILLVGDIFNARSVLPLCNFAVVCIITGTGAKILAVSLYAIMVYLFIRYDSVKLKWYVIIPAITVSWIIAALLSLGAAVRSRLREDGFCENDSSSIGVLAATIALRFVQIAVSLGILITFTALVYCYTSKNVISEDGEVKKAVARNLVYLLIDSIIFLLHFVVGTTITSLTAAGTNIVIVPAVLQGVGRLFVLLTPIAMLVLLKPLRLSLKTTCTWLQTKCCGITRM